MKRNIRQEDVLVFRLLQLLGRANPWECFTWAMKQLKCNSGALKKGFAAALTLLQPLPHLRHHQDCQLYSWRLLVGRYSSLGDDAGDDAGYQ